MGTKRVIRRPDPLGQSLVGVIAWTVCVPAVLALAVWALPVVVRWAVSV
jgi:hypothetical protein